MVSSTIPTSTWSHNCGMHVIADFLSEKLQQDNYKTVFTGQAYDELLKNFQGIYHQENLTWEMIRDVSLDSSRTDTQVVWGFVLRQMLPNILKDNRAFQEELEAHFLSVFHLLKENRERDAFEDHPIIFLGNKKYLQKKIKYLENKDAAEFEKQLVRIKKYWASHGFRHYCESTLKTNDEGDFIWLEEAEIAECAKYFGIETVNLDHKPNTPYDKNKLFLTNSSQSHWERDAHSNYSDKFENACYRSFFQEEVLSQGIVKYHRKIVEVGKRYFSEEYVKAERKTLFSLDLYSEPLKQFFVNNNKQGLIDYISAHPKISENELSEAINFGVMFCATSEWIDWLKFPGFIEVTKLQYDAILLIATRCQKKHLVKTLLAEFSLEYTAKNCMPALLMAAKSNDSFIAHTILNMPCFNQSNVKEKIFFKLTPAFRYVLNQYDEHNMPAVYYAIENQNMSLISSLINKGVCLTYMVNKQNGLMRALESNNLELIALLLGQTTSHHEWNTKNSKGENQFHIAAKQNAIHYLEKFNMQWKGLDSRNAEGMNCLHIAAMFGHIDAIEFCLKNGCSLYTKDNSKNTPLDLAKKHDRQEAMKYLEVELQKLNDASIQQKVLRFINPYVGTIFTDTEELEKTKIYTRLGLLKIGFSIAWKVPEGDFTAIGIEASKQAILYARPTLTRSAGQLYLYLKPKVHNYAWPRVATTFDYGATALGLGVEAVFAGVNYYDLYTNPGRRVAGFLGGQVALKTAKKYAPENESVQAGALFAGREAGFMMVDAYHAASPERKAQKAIVQQYLDPTLNRSYEIWTSLIGKPKAEMFIYYAHVGQTYQDSFYTNVGDLERRVLESAPCYAKVCVGIERVSSVFEYALDFSLANNCKAGVNTALNYISENLDSAALELKRLIHTYLVRESEYKNLILSYVHQQYIAVINHKLRELEFTLERAEQAEKTSEIKIIKDQIAILRQEISETETVAKNFYEQVNKGKITNQFNTAQELESKAWNDRYELEAIKNLNPDDLIESSIKKLGDELSGFSLSIYTRTMLNMYGIDIHPDDLAKFESSFELLKPEDADFSQKSKALFNDFFQSQTAKHIEAKNEKAEGNYQKNKLALDEITADFIKQATPEELRMLELNKNPEFKKQKYDWVAEQKKDYIQTVALVSTRYAMVTKYGTERDIANSNVIQAASTLEYSILNTEQELNRLDKTYNPLKTNYEKYKEILTPKTPAMDTLKKIIQDGNEDKNRRDYGTNLLLSCLVETGLIGYESADQKYKHKFYEALKVKGKYLEASVNEVFGTAMREVLDNTQVILLKVDQNIADLNSQLNKDKQQVISARNVLNEKEQAYQQAKLETLAKLTPEEQTEFKVFFRNQEETAAKFNHYSDAQSEKGIADTNYQMGIDKKTEVITLIEAKNIQIENLDHFSVTEQEMWDLVNNAYKADSNITEVNKYIINYFVQKGVGTFDQLSAQLWSTLCSGQKSSKDKYLVNHLYKRLCGQVEILNTHFIPNQKLELKKEIEVLQGHEQKIDENIAGLQLIQKNVADRAELTKNQYIQKLSPEQQAQFQSTLNTNIENQKKVTYEANIKNIFAMVGQGQLALESATYQDFLSEYGQSSLKISMTMAKQLLDYKYQFLPKPSEAEYQEELQAYTASLHAVEQANAFESVKANIDYTIAEFVYHQSNLSGETIPLVLNNLLKTDILTTDNQAASMTSIDLNQPGPAIKAIQQFIQTGVKSISVAQMGEHAIEKVWMPSVPKHHGRWHRATNNFKKMYHDNKEMIIATVALIGAIVAASMGDIPTSINLIGVAGGAAANAKVAGANDRKNSEPTVWQGAQHHHQSGMQAARNELHHNIRMVEAQNQAQSENLARRTELNSHHMENHALNHQAPDTYKSHMPSLHNSVYQDGVFGSQQESSYPGPLRAENLPAGLINSLHQSNAQSVMNGSHGQGGKAYLPFAYQQKAARPTTASAVPTQPSSNGPSKEQGNMINGWANSNKETDPMPGNEILHSILPRYRNIFVQSERVQKPVDTHSSTPSKHQTSKKSDVSELPRSTKDVKPKSHAQKSKPTKKHSEIPQSKNIPKYSSQQIRDSHSFYESFTRMAEPYLTSCGGNSDVRKNLCINNAYYQAGILNPYFLWPQAAVLGSAKVGQNIGLTQEMNILTFGLHSEIHELSIQLPIGNQAIFKDVMPIWMLYKKEGYAGIERIKDTLAREYKKSHDAILSAFRNQEILESKVNSLASSMKLPVNSPEVINKFFSLSENRELALDISMDLVRHEQTIVQKIYVDAVNSALTNPVNMAMGSFLHLDGVTVNGKNFSFAKWVKDPSNFEHRMAYFRAIFTEVVNLHANPIQTHEYHEQVRKELIFNTFRVYPADINAPQISASPWQQYLKDHKNKAIDFIHSGNDSKFTQLNR